MLGVSGEKATDPVTRLQQATATFSWSTGHPTFFFFLASSCKNEDDSIISLNITLLTLPSQRNGNWLEASVYPEIR